MEIVFRKEKFGYLGYEPKTGMFYLPRGMQETQLLKDKLSSPLFVIWEVTHKCNLNCVHCSSKRGVTEKDLNTLQCVKIIDKLRDNKIFHVIISGGEPFLRKDLFKILKKLNNENISFDIYTNGLLIDKKTIQNLKLVHPKRVYVSLDGLRRSHNYIRNANCFKKSIKSMESLKNAGINFGVITTLNSFNLLELDNFMKFLIARDVKFLKVNDMMPLGAATKRFDELHLCRSKLSKAVSILNKYKDRIDIDSEVLIDFSFEKTYRNTLCGLGKFVARIKSNGQITPCSFIDLEFGSMLKMNFEKDFWLSEELSELSIVPDDCMACKKFNKCAGGCKAVSLFYSGQNRDVRCGGPIK